MTNRVNPESLHLQTTALVGITVLIAIHALTVIARQTISPEIAAAFLTYDSVSSLRQALGKFLAFHQVWYRPLTFYLSNYLLFHAIDIHHIYLIKAISYGVILINAFIVTQLSRRIFSATRIEQMFTFALVVTHPLYYSIAYEGSGISDPIFTICLNLFLICFIHLLEAFDNKLGKPVQMTNGKSAVLCLLCCLFLAGTITSHERGVCLFIMAGILYLYYQLPPMLRREPRLAVGPTVVMEVATFFFILYLSLVYASKKEWAGQEYRTVFEPQYIMPNLLKAVELPLRFFFQRIGKGYDVHDEIVFNLLAAPLFLALLGYLAVVIGGQDRAEKRGLAILAGLYLCSLPAPVFFGGNIWHFYTAALYVSIATGRAVWFWIAKATSRAQPVWLALFFVWLIIATVRGINQELAAGTDMRQYMSLVPKALNDEVLNHIPYTPEVVYYDTGSYGEFTWPFGGQGNLFKYLYQNSRIVEIAINGGKVLESNRYLCHDAAGRRAILAFGFNAEDLSWRRLPEKTYCSGQQ